MTFERAFKTTREWYRRYRRGTSAAKGLTVPSSMAVVSTFPPRHCGVGRYAEQFAEHRGREGHRVSRIALPGGSGDVHLPANTALWPWRILRATRGASSVWLMWHPGLYLAGGPLRQSAFLLACSVVFRRRNVRVVVHEQEGAPHASSLAGRAQHRASAMMFRSASLVMFHSDAERRSFLRTFSSVPAGCTALVDHGASFRPTTATTREGARAVLGLPQPDVIFLCIGFLGAHKGFDRAIAAFAAATPDVPAKLFIVGSALYDLPEISGHIASLRASAQATTGVTLVEQWLSDEEFDLWLQAADVVLAPYRQIFSSSVVARAKLFSRPAIVSDVGALPEQVGEGDVVVRSDEELAAAIEAVLSRRDTVTGCTSAS